MTDPVNEDSNEEEREQSFAAMLDSYSAAIQTDINIGDKISGRVISIGKDTVFVDTGSKIDGVVDKAELIDNEQNLEIEEGDVVELVGTVGNLGVGARPGPRVQAVTS